MMKALALIAAVFLASSAYAAPPRPELTSDSIGPIHFGMTPREVEQLGFPIERSHPLLEGEEGYLQYDVDLGGDRSISVLFYHDRLSDISTRSARFATVEGARVGITLRELRQLYPNGHVNIGDEETFYFNYAIAPGVFFQFDPDGLPEGCFRYGGTCPDLSDRASAEYFLRDLSR